MSRAAPRWQGERPTAPPPAARLVAFALAIAALTHAPAPAAARGVGTDLAALALCLYGDCEARGTYVADPFGQTNPGTLSYMSHRRYLSRGAVASGSYFQVKTGGVVTDVGSGVVTGVWDPVVAQVATAYAEGEGSVVGLPGVALRFRTRAVRLAVGLDAEAFLGMPGFGLGLAGVVPGTTTDVSLAARGATLADSTERRDLEVVAGIHWHAGERDWVMLGGMLDVVRNGATTRILDPALLRVFTSEASTNAWFARAGLSLLPFVPLPVGPETSLAAQWLGTARVGVDLEYRSLSAPGEGHARDVVAYLGAETMLVPARWNPVSDVLQLWLLAGGDTAGGWGMGAGLYGQSRLQFLGCNTAYSSRPLTEVIGNRVEVFAVTCSAWLPF